MNMQYKLDDLLFIGPLTRKQAAARLGVSVRTIDRYIALLREQGKHPSEYMALSDHLGAKWGEASTLAGTGEAAAHSGESGHHESGRQLGA